jgi:hypothetical protein
MALQRSGSSGFGCRRALWHSGRGVHGGLLGQPSPNVSDPSKVKPIAFSTRAICFPLESVQILATELKTVTLFKLRVEFVAETAIDSPSPKSKGLMQTNRGGPAAIRGFRLQTLYAIHRLLETAGSDWIIKLEGQEDMERWSIRDEAIEFVQVKAYSAPLTLSNLEPNQTNQQGKKEPPFFRRVIDRAHSYPQAIQRLVIFGKLGPELEKAWESEGRERESIAQKLSEHYLSDEIEMLFKSVQFEVCHEDLLEADVIDRLGTGRLGGDPQTTLEILYTWLHRKSETSDSVSHENLIVKLNSIAQFLAQRNAHQAEWFKSIFPLILDPHLESNHGVLRKQFYEAFGAQFEHIAAGVDVRRTDKLKKIAEGFSKSNVVVVHGASGQGKNALAYRFLHDYVPSALRYEVGRIQDLQQSQSIALALREELTRIDEPMYVYVDVQPRGTDWVDLVASLSRYPQIRVLVTVREEDWAGGTALLSRVTTEEVALEFDQAEARELFEQLIIENVPVSIFDFDDAWERFSPAGPLLEFVYLVTQNERLQVRLEAQIRGIQEDIQRGQLETNAIFLLQVVSVAAAYGARVDLKRLLEILPLQQAQFTLQRLQGEYLLRSSPDGKYLEGLHPIRSDLLVQITEDDILHPWRDAAQIALNILYDDDLEIFLLHSFSRRQSEEAWLLETVQQLPMKSWSAMAGVMEALQWLDVRNHVEQNRDLIDDIYANFTTGWWTILRWDIPGITKYYPEFDWTIDWEKLGNLGEAQKRSYQVLKDRQINEHAEFKSSTQWLCGLTETPEQPQSLSDWISLGEVAFWVGFRKLSWVGINACTQLDFTSLLDLPIEAMSKVMLGLHTLNNETIHERLAALRPSVLEYFQLQTKTFAIIEDNASLTAHYVYASSVVLAVADLDAAAQVSESAMNEESVRRARLLCCIVPGKTIYGAQGHGHKFTLFEAPFDATTKRIPPWHLLPESLTKLNAIFKAIGSYPHNLVAWPDYVNEILEKRRRNLSQIVWMCDYVCGHFQRDPKISIDEHTVRNTCSSLNKIPPLPKQIFNEFGFIVRSQKQDTSTSQDQIAERFRSYTTAVQQVFSSCNYFHQQSLLGLFLHPILAKTSTQRGREAILSSLKPDQNYEHELHLAAHNLEDALKHLPIFQREFKNKFQKWLPGINLNEFDASEMDAFSRLLELWLKFAYHYQDTSANPRQAAQIAFEGKLDDRRKNLDKALKRLAKQGIIARIISEDIPWDDGPALWITFDIPDPNQLWAAYDQVLQDISPAIQWGSDRTAQAIVGLRWPNIVVVPTIRGKALQPQAWVLASIHLYGNQNFLQTGLWRYFPREIQQDIWIKLQLGTWAFTSLTLAFQKIHTGIARLAQAYSLLANLSFAPEPTGVGVVITQEYGEELATILGEMLNMALADFQALLPLSKSRSEFHELIGIISEVIQAQGKLIIDFHPTEDLEILEAWKLRSAEVLNVLEVTRLQWYAIDLVSV